MQENGVEPFEYTFDTTHTASQLMTLYEGKLEPGEEDEMASVNVAGRIMTRRVFGKLAFFTLQDGTRTIQLQFDKRRLSAEQFKVCVLGVFWHFEASLGVYEHGDSVSKQLTKQHLLSFLSSFYLSFPPAPPRVEFKGLDRWR